MPTPHPPTPTPSTRTLRTVIGKGPTLWERGAYTMDIAGIADQKSACRNLTRRFGKPTLRSVGVVTWYLGGTIVRLHTSFRGAYLRVTPAGR